MPRRHSRAADEPGPARFDPALRAWVLGSHADVRAALSEPRLATGPSDDGAAHEAVRAALAQALSPDRLAAFGDAFRRSARAQAAALPSDRRLDLVATFAAPWALSVAMDVTGAAPVDAPELAALARAIFLAAARRTDAGVPPELAAATVELARRLPEATSHVQTFVALSQTLPHLLGAAWLELLGQPAAQASARQEPRLPPQALDELLRLGGPARAVFRQARADVDIGAARIRAGDPVVLGFAAANRDPARFPDPASVDPGRSARDHLAFGGGAHACAGARLVRLAFACATEALLSTTSAIELAGPVTWLDGFAIRAPAALPAVLRREATAMA